MTSAGGSQAVIKPLPYCPKSDCYWQGEHDQAWKQRAAITTVLAERIEKGSGLLTMVDGEGKQWLIHSTNIAAANIRDRAETPDAPEVERRRIGFEPLILQRTAGSQAQAQIE